MNNFQSFLSGLRSFIVEMDADWEMVVDYSMAQLGQPTMSEWALIDRTFDETIA